MKKIIVAFFSCFILFCACKQNTEKKFDPEDMMADTTKFTTIKWQDTLINFGTKKMGDVVNIAFHCTNTGKKPLYLFDVRPGCGCTLVDYTKTPIAPGKQGMIEAKFDTKKSHPGSVHKAVFVSSNTSNTRIPYLKFSGTVLAADSALKN